MVKHMHTQAVYLLRCLLFMYPTQADTPRSHAAGTAPSYFPLIEAVPPEMVVVRLVVREMVGWSVGVRVQRKGQFGCA